jgi:16S rRNA G1207 methylase RsmC
MDVGKLREDIVFDIVLCGQSFTFHSTWGLFSPRNVDEGSRLLLDRIEVRDADDCLDLGCGYGAIGLVLARAASRGHTTLVDKDFVAVEYAERNAGLNGLENVEVLLSNGFGAVQKRDFDLIAANLPANTGKELLYLLLNDARDHLAPGGRLWVVTVSGLRKFIARAMGEVFGSYRKVKQGRTHTVACAVLPESP